MGILEVTGVVLLAAVIGALAAVLSVWARQRVISAHRPVMLCALRAPGSAWRLGFMHLAPDALDWYAAIGFTLRPNRSWPRPLLHVGSPQEIPETGGEPDQVLVTVGIGDDSVDLALARDVYFAMRSWVESPPPGQHVNVA